MRKFKKKRSNKHWTDISLMDVAWLSIESVVSYEVLKLRLAMRAELGDRTSIIKFTTLPILLACLVPVFAYAQDVWHTYHVRMHPQVTWQCELPVADVMFHFGSLWFTLFQFDLIHFASVWFGSLWFTLIHSQLL